MTYEQIKKWLEDNNYQNSGLRTDRNHRIDLYLSDVLFDFAQQQVKNLDIPAVMVRSEQLPCSHCGRPLKEHSKDSKLCPDRMKNFEQGD